MKLTRKTHARIPLDDAFAILGTLLVELENTERIAAERRENPAFNEQLRARGHTPVDWEARVAERRAIVDRLKKAAGC